MAHATTHSKSTAQRGRNIQKGIMAKERARKKKSKTAKKAKARRLSAVGHPTPPLPKQHQSKPGHESMLNPAPMYLAPHYRGSAKLLDKVAIITGADSGIGRAVATLFAREGAHVAIIYLEEDKDAEQTKTVVESQGCKALLLKGDVTDFEFCKEAVHRTMKEFGHVDILVNNAAYQMHAENIEDITLDHWDLTFKTNIYGYFHMAKATIPHMPPGSAIINTGSITALQGSKELLDYSATKGAIHTFTKSLAQQMMERGIRVNAVAPGPVWTPLNPSDRPAKKVSTFGKDVPMGRPAQPEEIAPTFVFLAAPSDSSYITGEIIPVVGGEQI